MAAQFQILFIIEKKTTPSLIIRRKCYLLGGPISDTYLHA